MLHKNHKAEKVLKQIEDLLDKNDMTIFMGHSGLIISYKNQWFSLMDVDCNEPISALPRSIDSERLVLSDS